MPSPCESLQQLSNPPTPHYRRSMRALALVLLPSFVGAPYVLGQDDPTDAELLCYGRRYSDLQKAFGSHIGMLRKHWNDYGRSERRNPLCERDWPELVLRRMGSWLVSALGISRGGATAPEADRPCPRVEPPQLTGDEPPGERPLLSFEVCGGLTNQRIALVQGLLIGKLTGRAVVLPLLNPNGRQRPDSLYAEDREHMVDFSTFYDRNATEAALRRLGIRLATDDETDAAEAIARALVPKKDRGSVRNVRGSGRRPCYYKAASRVERHLRLDCAFMSLDLSSTNQLKRDFWAIDQALVFSPEVRALADRVVAGLRRRSVASGSDGAFSALHLRTEADWLKHCSKWEALPTPRGEAPNDNCMTHTYELDRVLAIEGVSPRRPLYVAGEFVAADLGQGHALKRLTRPADGSASYDLVSKDSEGMAPDIFGATARGDRSFARSRDVLAAVDFAVCSAAHTFVGNSVSTFSAHLLLRRAYTRSRTPTLRGGREFHYNGGEIPLESAVFGRARRPHSNLNRNLKWVFTVTGSAVSGSTHSGSTATSAYDEMTKVAVLSALTKTTLVPVCVFTGARNALSAWLEAHGVRVVYHTPRWKPQLVEAAARAQQLGNVKTSPLYSSAEQMMATWLRLDVPTLGFVDRYIVYADVDVMWRSTVTLDDFGPNRPKFFTVGTETVGDFSTLQRPQGRAPIRVGNAGVMLMNVEGLRRTHAQFIAWVFSKANMESGLHFGEFGPGDQGAYTKFYQGHFDVAHWPVFNWKPYWGHLASARLVHFHGPKPNEYLSYLNRGRNLSASPPLMHRYLNMCREPVRDPALGPNGLPLGGEEALNSTDSIRREPISRRVTHTKRKSINGAGCTILLGEWTVWRDKIRKHSRVESGEASIRER